MVDTADWGNFSGWLGSEGCLIHEESGGFYHDAMIVDEINRREDFTMEIMHLTSNYWGKSYLGKPGEAVVVFTYVYNIYT
jgi:hypothetical protein